MREGDFEFWSYCFNQPKEKYYWKLFLPESLTFEQNFDVVEFSFVLFIGFKENIYCVISGSGASVIKKFTNPNFGIDVYQRFANPNEDVIIDLETRGIASNISQKKQIFNLDQTLSLSMEYSEIPVKIKLRLRDEIKKNIFSDFKLDDSSTILEVGSYFALRKKMDFEELKTLVTKADTIYSSPEVTQLTLFSKINDPNITTELDKVLIETVATDILSYGRIGDNSIRDEVIEVVHPTKLEKFYECDNFIVKLKYSRGKSDISVIDRNLLYGVCTKAIYDSLAKNTDRLDAENKLFTLSITGQIKKSDETYANFFSHLIAEIEYLKNKYFRIDGRWYMLEDEFLARMNLEAIEFYERNRLSYGLLNRWGEDEDEGKYNLNHEEIEDYFVFDKILTHNIELCDLLIVKQDLVYFVHVKKGFDTKMRDLYVQMLLSAKKLSMDLMNNKGSVFLKNAIINYNKVNPLKEVVVDELVERLKKNPSQITFVMAYNNEKYKKYDAIEKIKKSKSNIAKYSLVQIVKEMQQFKFGIKIIDISEL